MALPFKRNPPLGPPRPTARETVLTEWRRVNYAPLEIMQKDVAKSVGSLVPNVWKTMKVEQRLQESQIIKVWNSSIDPVVAQHAQPTGLNKGTLFVKVDSNVWMAEIIRYRKREILERLQSSFGKDAIKKISFTIG